MNADRCGGHLSSPAICEYEFVVLLKLKKMKKNFLSIAAVAVAIAASAFTAPSAKSNGKLISYKWFQISGNLTPSQNVPSANATYLGEGETPPAGSGCSGTSYQCVSGFNSSQVNSSNQLIGAQMPQAVARTKN
jgi:hypothetical protein